jgi:hypothetical protein
MILNFRLTSSEAADASPLVSVAGDHGRDGAQTRRIAAVSRKRVESLAWCAKQG